MMDDERVTSGRISESAGMTNMTVGKLKEIMEELPDDMTVIIPITDEDNSNAIYGFRYVRTSGVLVEPFSGEKSICLSPAAYGFNITNQLKTNGFDDIDVAALLF